MGVNIKNCPKFRKRSMSLINIQSVHKRRIIVLIILVIILITGWTLPYPHKVRGSINIESTQVWYLMSNGANEIITGWRRNILETGGDQILMQFERPDLVEVKLAPNLQDRSFVQKGDTLAKIISSENIAKLKILNAELDKARAEYNALRSGARQEDIEVALKHLERERAASESCSLEVVRARALYNSSYISLGELQIRESDYKVQQAEVEEADAEYASLKAGAKIEDLAVAKSEIILLEKAVENARKTLGDEKILISPINGQIRLGGNTYMVRVEATEKLVVLMVIPESIMNSLTPENTIRFRLQSEESQYFEVNVLLTDFFGGDMPGAYAIGLLENPDGRIQVGMTGQGSISVGQKTLFEGFRLAFHQEGRMQ